MDKEKVADDLVAMDAEFKGQIDQIRQDLWELRCDLEDFEKRIAYDADLREEMAKSIGVKPENMDWNPKTIREIRLGEVD